MTKEELVEYMHNHCWCIRQGAKLIAKKTHSELEDVLSARREIRNQMASNYSNVQECNSRQTKILIFDIETAPMKAYVWKRWKENISLDQTISEWFVICWSAKWLYSDEVMGDVITPAEIKYEDDSRIVKGLWELFNEADIIIAHNGNRFDIPKMNSRFIINGLNPPSSYKSVDTCVVAKKQFGFSSNKLDALAEYFGFEHKLDTDFDLWKRCLNGDKEALWYMLKYNKRDVTLLEQVYLKLLPWINHHPNLASYSNSIQLTCPNCGSGTLKALQGKYYYTRTGKYQLYRCQCGCISRDRTNLNNKVKNINIIQ